MRNHRQSKKPFHTHPDLAKAKARTYHKQTHIPESMSLLDAIRTANRAAHRWRIAAHAQYKARNYEFATYASAQMRYFYKLKDLGIAAAYKQGMILYCGQTPQGMALYSYGYMARYTVHSCLHPIGVCRRFVTGHPEVLFVIKRPKRQRAVIATQSTPSIQKPTVLVICSHCGGKAHDSAECRYSDQDRAEALLLTLPEPGDEFESTARPAYREINGNTNPFRAV